MDRNELLSRLSGYSGSVLAEYIGMAYPHQIPGLFDELDRISLRQEIGRLQVKESEAIEELKTFGVIETDEEMTAFMKLNAAIDRNYKRQRRLLARQRKLILKMKTRMYPVDGTPETVHGPGVAGQGSGRAIDQTERADGIEIAGGIGPANPERGREGFGWMRVIDGGKNGLPEGGVEARKREQRARLAGQRRGLLAKIHIALKDLGIEDENYREILWTVFRQRSSKHLSIEELQHLVRYFEGRGWQPTRRERKTNPDIDQAIALRDRAREIAAEIPNGEKRLQGLVKKICGVGRLEWARDAEKLERLLAALGNIARGS